MSLIETSKVIYSFEDEFILGNCYSDQNLTGAETQSDWVLSVLKCFILLYPKSSASAACMNAMRREILAFLLR